MDTIQLPMEGLWRFRHSRSTLDILMLPQKGCIWILFGLLYGRLCLEWVQSWALQLLGLFHRELGGDTLA